MFPPWREVLTPWHKFKNDPVLFSSSQKYKPCSTSSANYSPRTGKWYIPTMNTTPQTTDTHGDPQIHVLREWKAFFLGSLINHGKDVNLFILRGLEIKILRYLSCFFSYIKIAIIHCIDLFNPQIISDCCKPSISPFVEYIRMNKVKSRTYNLKALPI